MIHRSYKPTVLRAALGLAAWSGVHSLLAAVRTKELVRDWLGERRVSGLYRLAYNLLAVLSLGAFLRFVWPLPDRRLYTVRGLPRRLLVTGQASSALALLVGGLQVGPIIFGGLSQVWDYLAGRPIRPTPVAQHPLPKGGRIRWRGPYRLSRHPLNYFVLVAYWLSPVMTLKWAVVGLVGSVHIVLGSKHEGHRLRLAYGEEYERYRRQVPHAFVPFSRLLRGRRS